MMKGFSFVIILTVVLCLLQPPFIVLGQSKHDIEIKKAVDKIGMLNDVTVVRNDGQWFYGRIESIDNDSLTVSDIDQKINVVLKFDQVDKVFKGIGTKRDRNGHRIPPSRSRKGLIIASLLVAVPVILIIIASQSESDH